jgi:hypothetical protein
LFSYGSTRLPPAWGRARDAGSLKVGPRSGTLLLLEAAARMPSARPALTRDSQKINPVPLKPRQLAAA